MSDRSDERMICTFMRFWECHWVQKQSRLVHEGNRLGTSDRVDGGPLNKCSKTIFEIWPLPPAVWCFNRNNPGGDLTQARELFPDENQPLSQYEEARLLRTTSEMAEGLQKAFQSHCLMGPCTQHHLYSTGAEKNDGTKMPEPDLDYCPKKEFVWAGVDETPSAYSINETGHSKL